MKHSVDIFAVATFVSAGGLAGLAEAIGAFFPPKGPTIANSVAIGLCSLAGLIRVIYNQTNAPATSIVAGAPVVLPSKGPAS